MIKKAFTSTLIGCALLLPLPGHAETALPEIGSESFSVITQQQEYRLGRAWSRMLRGSAKLYEDALVSQYIEELTWSLVTYSQLNDRRLEIITLDNGSLNAFAVPGGIIGIHAGLLLAANSEAELASVISHELAHLSQRHFAAQLEEQRRNQPLMLASLLGSILLASASSEGGMVALQSTMAASASSRLSFSRQNEREADYIGMQTLAASGYDPHAMPEMFSQMQKLARFSRVPPEFLLTHPITQSRISDSLNRAESFSSVNARYNSEAFNIAKARIEAHYTDNPKQLLARNNEVLKKHKNDDSLRYAVVVAAIAAEDYALANKAHTQLSDRFKASLNGRLLQSEISMKQQDYSSAAKSLAQLQKLYPDNQAIRYLYAECMIHLHQPAKAVRNYEYLVNNQPNDSRAWYLLAEAYGLNGDIVGVHDARIEFFLLTANIDKAMTQIEYALKEPGLTNQDKARFKQRKEEALQIRKSLEMDF